MVNFPFFRYPRNPYNTYYKYTPYYNGYYNNFYHNPQNYNKNPVNHHQNYPNSNINQKDYYKHSQKNKYKSSTNSENSNKNKKKSSKYNSFGPINFQIDNLEEPIVEILGIELYLDDIIILVLLYFLYKEEVKDETLFISLILLLIA